MDPGLTYESVSYDLRSGMVCKPSKSSMPQVSATFGFNAQTEEYVDRVQAGVIDPAKVVRTALQDAASVAGLLITTEAAVVEAPKKGGGAPGGMPGGMGDMGGMDF